MKLIIILLLFPFVTWGQNLFPSKGIRRTTTPNNGKFVDSPSFNSESRTISNKATKEKPTTKSTQRNTWIKNIYQMNLN